ncbi:MAG: hypothetical protein OEQ39_00170 [Gammaproteobacteria bacterium]|nr:hypothetical protein [Gammaproteobacteria bacterium]
MASVQIADVYNPLVFNQAIQEAAIEKNAFLASGVMVQDALVTQAAQGPGNIGDLPFYLGLDNPQYDGTNQPNYVNDVPGPPPAPAKIGDGLMKWRKAFMHRSWSTMDLAREIALADPVQAITNRIGKYWAVNNELRLISSAMGILADNVANDSGDMLYQPSILDEAGNPDTGDFISNDAVIQAKATLGDHADNLQVLAMHSVPYARLQGLNLIQFVRDSDNNIMFSTYLGYRLVIDDSLPAVAGTVNPARTIYTSVLFAGGQFAFGQGSPERPSELEREAGSGNGGGEDIIHSRQTNIIHPVGFSFESGAVSLQSPTIPELRDALNWNRVYVNRKNVGIAFLQTNG